MIKMEQELICKTSKIKKQNWSRKIQKPEIKELKRIKTMKMRKKHESSK